MSKQTKQCFLDGLFTALVVAVMMVILVLVPNPNPLYWAPFIAFPASMLMNPTPQRMPFMWANVLIGQGLGIVCMLLCGVLTPMVGLAASFGVGAGVMTLVLFVITVMIMGKFGYMPVAFSGFLAVFVAGTIDPTTMMVVAISTVFGIFCAMVINRTGILSAKIVGAEES